MAVAGAGFVAFIGEGLLATSMLIPAIALMAVTVVAVFYIGLQVARRM